MKHHKMVAEKQGEDPEHRLYTAVAAIKTAEEARLFFQDLCTPNEIEAMADRWRVVGLVRAGMPYRDIHQETGVSVTTVGRVARCLMLGEGGYNLIYERTEKKYHENTKTQNCHSKIRAAK